MQLQDLPVFITGGGSGMGAATGRLFAAAGARVTLFDRDADRARAVAAEIGGVAAPGDVTSPDDVKAALAKGAEAHGAARAIINCAGIGWAERVVGRDGPHDLERFRRVIEINLIGSFNVLRLAAAAIADAVPFETGERGLIVNTASIAAYDGQIGQAAYSASKGGLVGMTLPIARDLAGRGIRVVTIAPGLIETPLFANLNPEARASLEATLLFPKRLGLPEEFAALARHIVENPMLNGETIRLDGALRMAPR